MTIIWRLADLTLRFSLSDSQTIAGLKSDKSSLDSALYEQQQVSANLETKKEQLEGENQDLILKKEALQSKYMYISFYLAQILLNN